jgi:sulfur carrier protein
MLLSINGEERAVQATDLGALIDELGLDRRKIAVELNLSIVPRSLHASTPLHEGDRLELVQFVGGG